MEQQNERLARGASARLVLLFALAFAATCALLRGALPGGSGLDTVETKLAHFAEQRGDFDLLFFGSSRTFRGFDPARFDRAAAESGLATHSFNFGVPGSHALEVQHLLGRVVELAPPRVRFVLVDPEGLNVMPDTRNSRARKVIDWHDPESTGTVTRLVLESQHDALAKAELIGSHWGTCALNLTNVGRALRWVDAWLGRRAQPAAVAEILGPAGDGYSPLGEEGSELGRRGKRFKNKKVEQYLEHLAVFRSERVESGAPSEAALELYHRIERRASELGAVTVFVTQPALYHQVDLIRAHERGEVQYLLRYDDPERFPELYAPENRYDDTHLNDQGAELFTALLARDLAALATAAGLAR